MADGLRSRTISWCSPSAPFGSDGDAAAFVVDDVGGGGCCVAGNDVVTAVASMVAASPLVVGGAAMPPTGLTWKRVGRSAEPMSTVPKSSVDDEVVIGGVVTVLMMTAKQTKPNYTNCTRFKVVIIF